MEVIESIHLLLILNVRFGWYLRKIGQWVQPQLAATRMFPPEKQRLIVNGQLLVGIPFSSLPKLDYLQEQREQAALLQQTSPR